MYKNRGRSYCGQTNPPGEGSAIASLVLGIISCLTILVYAFSGRLSLGAIAVILGFVGIGAGNAAKNSGYRGGLRIAGTVVSWVGAVFGAIVCGKLLFVTML